MPLVISKRHRGVGATLLHRLVDRTVDLAELAINVCQGRVLFGNTAIDVGNANGDCRLASNRGGDVRLRQEPVGADGIEPHQCGNRGDQEQPQSARSTTQPDQCDGPQLAGLKHHAQGDDRPKSAAEHAGQPDDGETGAHGRHSQRDQDGDPVPLRRCVNDSGSGNGGTVNSSGSVNGGPVPVPRECSGLRCGTGGNIIRSTNIRAGPGTAVPATVHGGCIPVHPRPALVPGTSTVPGVSVPVPGVSVPVPGVSVPV